MTTPYDTTKDAGPVDSPVAGPVGADTDTDGDTGPAPVDTTPDEYTPRIGDVVRLDDPSAGDGSSTPQYALYVDEDTVVPLPGARTYQLPVYESAAGS